MNTTLKIGINLGGAVASQYVPTREDLEATSTLALDNGTFTIVGMKVIADHSVPVRIEFVDESTVAVTAVGAYSGGKIVFPKSQITIGGLVVAVLGNPAPPALIGTMTHRAGLGDMVVSSTGNPAGDRLESALASRKMALVP